MQPRDRHLDDWLHNPPVRDPEWVAARFGHR